MWRVASSTLVSPLRSAAAAVIGANAIRVSRRFDADDKADILKKHTPRRKVNLDDDERWLEAEFDEKVNTPEERYAHAQQLRALRNLVEKVKEDANTDLKKAVDDRNDHIADLHKKINDLQTQLSSITGKK